MENARLHFMYKDFNLISKFLSDNKPSIFFNPFVPMHPFSTPENIRKPSGFLMFLEGRERVYWEQMG